MHIVVGIIVIFICSLAVAFPREYLAFEDLLRIKGNRQYSEFAINLMRVRGILGIIAGILLLFVDIF